MTGQSRAFLPAGALTEERISHAIADPLDTWSRTYFAAADIDVCGVQKQESRAPDTSTGPDARTSFSLTVPGRRRLLETALGESLDGKIMHEADRQLLDAFADRLVSELVELFDRALTPVQGPSLTLDISIDGRPIGHLTVSHQAIITRVRRALPTKVDRTAFVQSRLGTVAQLEIPVEGVLGRSRLTVEDASGLAVGDVLILDRGLEQDAEVRVCQDRVLVARGRLVPDKGRNTIIVGEIEKGLN